MAILSAIIIASVSLIFTGCNSNSIKQFFSGKEPSSIADEDNGNGKSDIIDGGWAPAENPDIPGEFIKVFDKATETLAGAQLTPVAYIASQVVAGTNHLVLCSMTATVPDAKPVYAIVTVYENLEGNAEITNIVESDIPAASDAEGIVGGWTPSETPALTDESKKALEKASEALTGADYKPIALLATQVVAGTNYELLCKMTATVPNATGEYVIVHVYADLQGNAEITDTFEFNSAQEETVEEQSETTTGN